MRSLLILAALLAASSVQAQDWSVATEKGQPARLTFGEAGLTLQCPPGAAGEISVSFPLPQPPPAARPASVILTSGADRAVLRGMAAPGSGASAEVSSQAPVIAAFRKTGVLSVAALDQTLTPPPAKTGLVRRFLGACR